MAAGSTTLSTLLAGLKAHAGAAAVAGAVVVGGGAAAAAVATGAVHLPQGNSSAPSTATQIANCASHNGDAASLAGTYKSMFGGNTATATTDICTIFVGTSGRHFGFGEVRQILDIAAAIEVSGSDACLTSASSSSSSTDHGKPTATPSRSGGDHGRPTVTPGSSSGDHGGSTGQPTLKIPSASASTTMADVQAILKADPQGTPLARLAQACGAPVGTDSSSSGGSQPDATPEATEATGK